MIRIRLAFVGITLLSLLATASSAQVWAGPAGIEIEVTSRGKPVAGARVLLRYREAPKGSFAVLTDSKGRAAVVNLAPGAWNIEVSHVDYLSYVAAVTLEPGKKASETTSFLQATGTGREAIRIKYQKASGPIGTPVEAPAAAPRAVDPIPAPAPRIDRPEPETAPAPGELREPDIPAPSAPEPEPAVPEQSPAAPAVELREPDIPEPSTPAAETPVAEGSDEPEVEGTELEEPTIPEAPAPPVSEPAPIEPVDEPRPETEPPFERPAPPEIDEPFAEPVSAPAVERADESAGVPVTAPEPAAAPAPEAPGRAQEAELPATAELETAEVEPEPVTVPDEAAEAAPPAVPEPTTPALELPEPAAEAPSVPAPAPVGPPVVETEPVPPPTTPTPEAAPEIAEPGPESPTPSVSERLPAPAPTPRVPSPSLRAFHDRTCPECKPGEWSAASVEIAGPLGSGDACPPNARDLAEKAARRVARAPLGSLAGFAGPAIGGVSPTALELIPEGPRSGVVEALDWSSNRCRLLAVSIPRGAKFQGFRYEAADESGQADCIGDQDCPVGDSTFLGNPGIERGQEVTVVYSVFENRSTDRERRARLTVYFVPAAGWRP